MPYSHIIDEGQAIASATTISVRARVHRVTGSTTIQTINPPYAQFAGTIVLIPTDASTFSLGTSGNIALAVTGTQYKAIALTRSLATGNWYPTAVS